MMNGRRRQRNVIIDSSSSEEDEVVAVVMDNSNPTNRVGTLGLGWNDDASDSSSSLEGYLRALRVVDAPPEPENIEMAEEQEDVTSDLDDSSSGESEDLEDVEVMDEEVVVEPPPTRDEEEQAGIDVDSDFSLDRSANEVYLSSDKAKNNIQWPAFRVPVPLWKRLYDYQKTGVSWMAGLHANRVGGILGDDMGMGKTYMTLTYLGGLMRAGTIRSALVLAPLSVLRAWENEANKVLTLCMPAVQIQVLSSSMGAHKRRWALEEALESSPDYPTLVISTYGQVQSNSDDFSPKNRSPWDYVVLDEGHLIKNPAANTSKCCRKICSHRDTRRLMLTGTPVQNNLKELWALFDWATSSRILGELKQFTRNFARPIEQARNKYASEGDLQRGERNNKELQALIKPYFIQRMKEDFLKDKLPPKIELVLWTHLSIEQRSIYTGFVEKESAVVKSIMAGEKTSPLEAVTWLKKLCGHPLLLAENRDGEDLDSALNTRDAADIVKESAKLGILLDLIKKFSSGGHRTLIFSQSTKMLDIIQKALEEVVTLARIDGSTAEKHRQSIVDDFNSGTSVVDAMLLSTKAAGVGLTLTGADRVVIYDPSWTPAEDSQAVDRAYRIGQTKKVFVYRMITAGTVEEKMYEKQVHKDGIRRAVFTEDTTVERHFDKDDLRKLFNLAPPGVCEVMEKVQKASQGLQRSWGEYEFALSHRGVVGLSRHDGFYHNKPAEEDENETAFDGKASAVMKVLGRSQRALQNDATKKLPVERTVVEIDDDDDDDKENATIEIVSPPRASIDKFADEVELVDPPTPRKDIESEAIEWQEVVEVVDPPTPREDTGSGKIEWQEEVEVVDPPTSLESEAIEWQRDVNPPTPHEDIENEAVEWQQDVNPPIPHDNVESEAIDEKESEESVATMFQRVELLASNGCPKRAFKLLLDMLEYRYADLDREEKIEVHTQICLAATALGLL